jgi:hypothetical protein
MDNNKDIPYIAYEAAQSRLERIIKRLWITTIILIVLLVGSNIGWLIYESQFTDYEITQESETGTNNYIGNDGDISYGEAND